MVTKTLVEANVEAGRRLITELDQRMDVRAALWLWLPEGERWRLILASEQVDTEGPRVVYTLILDTLEQMPPDVRLALEDISVVGLSDRMIQQLGAAIKTGKTIREMRFSNSAFNGVFLDEALIYRLDL